MPIIGTGDIGSILEPRKGALFFASGVSNSVSSTEEDFKRELELLRWQDQTLCLFYFSTISIFYKQSPYINHKKKMELFIKSNWNNYNIIRIGNISWGNNPNTFVNALRVKKAKGEPIEFLDEWRFMIDKEELLLLTNNLPLKGQHEINVFSKMGKPIDFI